MKCHGAPVLHLHQTRLDQVFVRLYLSLLSLQITGAIMSDDEMEQPGFLIRTDPKKANKADHLAGQPATEPASSNSVENEEGATSVQPSETDDLVAHPYANLFPMMRGKVFEKFVSSIREDGLHEAIVTYEGKILDGRNRHAACIEAGVKPNFDEYKGTDPLGYVFRKNLHRRNLNTSQRSMAAARRATLSHGGDHKSGNFKTSIDVLKIKDVAELFVVSPKSVERAKFVQASGRSDLIKAVDDGTMTVAAAAKELEEPVVLTGEQESQRLLKLWDKTGEEGRALFLQSIGAKPLPETEGPDHE